MRTTEQPTRAGGALLLAAIILGPLLLAGTPRVRAAAAGTAPPAEAGWAETVVRGVTVASAGRAAVPLAKAGAVRAGDTIETGPDAAVRLRLADGARLSLGPGTRAVIERWRYDPATREGGLVATVPTGVFEFTSGDMHRENYDLRTPFARLALRGTVFGVDVLNEAIVVVEGEAEARFLAGDTVRLRPSECVLGDGRGGRRTLTGPLCQREIPAYLILLAVLNTAQEDPLGELLADLPSPDRTRTGLLSSTLPTSNQAPVSRQ